MRAVADLLYPEACIGCGRLARGGLCQVCLDKAAVTLSGFCNRCGAAAATNLPDCLECRGRGFHFDRARQFAEFRSVARLAILRFKYRGQLALAEVLAAALASTATPLEPKVVTWVPTSQIRVRQRGFDHGRLLAEAFARELDLFCAELLHRAREAAPQVGLEPDLRRENLVDAFRCKLPAPERVLVVDDVFTTGASASEAARALKVAGATSVDAVAFARAYPRHKGGMRG